MELDWPDKDGVTLRKRLRNVSRKGIEDPRLASEPEIPEAGLRAWVWFWDLSGGRGHSGSGPLPLNYREIRAWRKETHSNPTPWEIDVIRRMDREYLDFAAQKQREAT